MREMVSSVDASLRSRSAVSRSMSLFRTPHSALRTSERGFTLIELAIVLVIIGIIIGAVLKGQDLMDSARAKKFVNDVKKWEIMTWTFMDRKGRMPGDGGTSATLGKNGVIGDDTTATTGEQTATTNGAYELINSTFTNPPVNPVAVGSDLFYVYLGYFTDSTKKNVIAICGVAACTTAFTSSQMKFIESLDSALDGTSGALAGNVQAYTAATCAPTPCAQNGSAITGGTADTAEWSAVPATPTAKALFYFFDKPHS